MLKKRLKQDPSHPGGAAVSVRGNKNINRGSRCKFQRHTNLGVQKCDSSIGLHPNFASSSSPRPYSAQYQTLSLITSR